MANPSDPGAMNPTLADWLATTVSDDLDTSEVPRLPRLRLGVAGSPGLDLQLGDLLGVGGMAVVTRAEQLALGRDVAVKRSRQPENPSAVRGLLREAWVTGQLDHPNVVPVHLVGETEEGEPVVVLRAIGGQNWLERLAADPADDPEALNRHLAVFVAVCNAVHYAHERGFLHRDVKPANVQIGDVGEVYLLDWGVAAPMDQAVLQRAGTPAYMAPEMLDRCAPDRRSDVFLLGSTLLEVVTGRPPRDGTATSEIEAGATSSVALELPPGLPPGLGVVIARACAHRVEERYPDAAALRDAVLAWEVDQGVQSLLEAARERLEGFVQAADRSEAEPDLEAAAAVARERFAAARFGFEQVIADRPEHEGAREGLGRCLERMIRLELAHGQASSARALLAAHPGPSEALRQEVEARAAGIEAQAAEQARLARVAKAYDTSEVARDWLVLLGVCTAVVAASIFVTNAVVDPGMALPPSQRMMWLLGPSAVALPAVVLWKRRSMIDHPVGQRLSLAAAGLLVAIIAGRAAQIGAGIPYQMQSFGEPFLMAAWILGSSAYLRRLVWVGALGLVGATLNTMLMGHVHQVNFQNVLSLAMIVGFSLVWWQALRLRSVA